MKQERAGRRGLPAIALAVLSAVLLAACGSSDDGSSSSASESGSGSAALVPAPPTEPPTDTPITTPLPERPPHKKVIWLACALPVCQGALSAGDKDAAAALDWDFEQINFETVKAADAVQQALNENPDFIMLPSIPPAVFAPQAKEAIRRGIPIISGFDTTTPDPKKNGLYMQYGNVLEDAWKGSEYVADWIINDSGGKAHLVSIAPNEYPSSNAAAKKAADRLAAKCPDCTADTLNIGVQDIGEGTVPAKIVAYLQSHPETDYIMFTFSDLGVGVYPALQAAGLADKVKLTGIASDKAMNEELSKGHHAAWTVQGMQFAGWLSMDAAARLSLGLPLEPYEKSGAIPMWVVDSEEKADELLQSPFDGWPGPEGFQDKFKELWKVN